MENEKRKMIEALKLAYDAFSRIAHMAWIENADFDDYAVIMRALNAIQEVLNQTTNQQEKTK